MRNPTTGQRGAAKTECWDREMVPGEGEYRELGVIEAEVRENDGTRRRCAEGLHRMLVDERVCVGRGWMLRAPPSVIEAAVSDNARIRRGCRERVSGGEEYRELVVIEAEVRKRGAAPKICAGGAVSASPRWPVVRPRIHPPPRPSRIFSTKPLVITPWMIHMLTLTMHTRVVPGGLYTARYRH